MRTFQSNRTEFGPGEWFGRVWRGFVGSVMSDNDHDPGTEPSKMFEEPPDHRQELYYDPLMHNDDPDPRFDDD